nr:hypothetical protein [Tanacetum cinerariifolium]
MKKKDSPFESKNYASSSWCSEELAKIMVLGLICKKMEGGFERMWSVGDAFVSHKKNEAARIWREALKEAFDLAGWELKSTANGSVGLWNTPERSMLILTKCHDLAQLYLPGEILELDSLHLSYSKLRTFDLGLTPNLEKLSLEECCDLEKNSCSCWMSEKACLLTHQWLWEV